MDAHEGPESIREAALFVAASSMLSGLSADDIELLQKRAARYAAATEDTARDVAEAVVFRRGESRYGVALGSLREVRPLRAFCRIPLASPVVPGILHFRGEILSVHDVAAFMEPRRSPLPNPSWVIVVEHNGERIGLLGDEIIDIERYSLSGVLPLPITLGDRAAICDGVLPGGVVLLSAARMFHTDEFVSAF